MPKVDGLSCRANHTGVVASCCAMPRPACRNWASSFSLPDFASRRTNNACLIMVDSKVENQRLLLAAPRERDAISGSAHARQRIVGELDTGGEIRGLEQKLLLRLRAVGHHFSQRQYAELDDLAVIRPRLARILGLIAGFGQLRLQVKNKRFLRDPLGQLVEQIIR